MKRSIVLVGLFFLALLGIGAGLFRVYAAFSADLSGTHPGRLHFAIRVIDPPAPQPLQDTGRFTSLAFNSSGAPLISYYSNSDQDLRLASPVSSGGNCGPGNTWNCQTIDAAGDVGKYSSIAVGNAMLVGSSVGIAYYDDTNNALKYAERRCLPLPCHWNIETVADTPFEDGLGLSLKMDAQGSPHIAYYTRGQVGSLNYASYVGPGGNCGSSNSWQCDEIDFGGGDAGMDPSLALNAAGLPRIAYAHYDTDSGTGRYNLWFASYSSTPISNGGCNPNSTHWSCIRISTGASEEGHHISLAIAPDPVNGLETAHIASYSFTNEQVYYARNNSSYTNCGEDGHGNFTWACMKLASLSDLPITRDLGVTSIATDLQGSPIIAYTRENAGALSLGIARPIEAEGLTTGNCGAEVLDPSPHLIWQCTELDPGVAEHVAVGLFPSVAVRATGRVGIAYWKNDGDNPAGVLKFADQQLLVFLPLVKK